jgi:Zn-dependent protease
VPVYLHPSWFVVTVVITVLYTGQYSALGLPQLSATGALGAGLAAAALLLLSVFLHEVSHAAAARRWGSPPTHITLDLWGGHTGFSAEQPTPGSSALVSVVGPATNALLAAVGWSLREPSMNNWVVLGLLTYSFTYTNLFVAVFNALPGLPLDGGRVLEALVWRITGDRLRATVVAGWCGRVVAVAVLAWAVGLPLLRGGTPSAATTVWLGLIALMLWRSAGAAIGYVAWQRRTSAIRLTDLMEPVVTVAADRSLAAALAAGSGSTAVLLTDPDGVVTGVLDRAAAAAVPEDRHSDATASTVASVLPASAHLPVDAVGADLLELLRADPQPRYVVTDHAGAPVGLLRWQAVADRIGTV